MSVRKKYRVTETCTYIIRVPEGDDPEQYFLRHGVGSGFVDFEAVVERDFEHIDTLSGGDR